MAGTKSRLFSIIVTIVMIISAIIIGGMRSLGGLEYQMEQIFENGVNPGLSGTKSAQDYINMRINEANNLLLAGENKMDLEYEKEVYKAIDAVKNSKNIREKAETNAYLTETVENLNTHLQTLDLSGDKSQLREKSISEFEAAGKAIGESEYSKRLQSYNDQMSAFPANILRNIVSIDLLPSFTG